ncbi:MAG TPA: NAD(P)-dependent oxidoreductase [Burkholderiaceae bacterium]|nr:NAD(P)-dependent oxidoreductase [Burkholderiaceae bacterium]
MQPVLGFVGLGQMGRPMAGRLLAAGYRLLVLDREPQAVAALVDAGAVRAESPAQMAESATHVLLSLPDGAAVQEVVEGRDGLVARQGSGRAMRCVIDFSTIGPRAARRVAARLAENGIDHVDAPVSGGTAGARDGRLSIMAACPPEVLARDRALLEQFGKVFHVGETAGQAQIVKLANNLLNVAAIALTSEAMVMGAKAGLDCAQMLDIINASTGRNSATMDKFPRAVLPGTFDFGFATGHAYKDVGLCIDEAEAMGIPMVVGAAVRQLLSITNAQHGPQSDFTSVCRVVESWAGAEVRSRPPAS